MRNRPEEAVPRPSSSPMNEAALQLNDMGFSFLRVLPKDSNVVISPYAIANLLMMLYQGSAGETRRAVDAATRTGVLAAGFGVLFDRVSTELLNDVEGQHEFDMASLVLVGGPCDTDRDTARYLAKYLNGRTQPVPGSLFSMECKERLWKWAIHSTRGEINHVLDISFDPKAQVVAASALFFRGSFAPRLNARRTRMEPFVNMEREISRVAMVQSQGVYGYVYSRQMRVRAVHVPYDPQLSLVLIIPVQPGDLLALERGLDRRLFGQLLEKMRNGLVDLKVPRFTMQQATSLKGFLTRLGLECLFTQVPGPDFSYLHGRKGLPIGNLYLLARVLMDEGSPGLCQGECAFSCRALRNGEKMPMEFHVSHPFLFYVLHSESQAVLLMGRLLRL